MKRNPLNMPHYANMRDGSLMASSRPCISYVQAIVLAILFALVVGHVTTKAMTHVNYVRVVEGG